MVDVSKIRVGDEVTVRGKVIELSHGAPLVMFDQPDRVTNWQFHADASTIATHTPAPREFKPGDKVEFKGLDGREYKGEFVIRHEDKAIVCTHVWPDFDYMWPQISKLRHADEPV